MRLLKLTIGMSYSCILLLLTFLSGSLLMAQPSTSNFEAPALPSAEAQVLAKFIDQPLVGSNGAMTQNIDLVTVTENDLSLPVRLRYHGSGIRTGEIATNVGIGFSLDAGGIISRSVRGIRDESATTGFLEIADDIDITNGPFLYDTYTGETDSEPDVYNFNIPGYDGQFTFITEKDLDGKREVRMVPFVDLKVEYELEGNQFKSFVITNPSGTRYIFGFYSDDSFTSSAYCESGLEDGLGIPNLERNEWRLVRVESFNRNSFINLSYEEESYTTRTDHAGSFVSISPEIERDLTPYDVQQYRGKRLSNISATNMGVAFNYGAIRQDLGHGGPSSKAQKLRSIDIATGDYAFKWEFSQDYFQASNNPTVEWERRLRLERLQKIGISNPSASEPAYEFDYVKKDGVYFLPSRLSNAIDFWGYYNDQVFNDDNAINIPNTTVNNVDCDGLCGSNRLSNEEAMQYGTLSSIKNPLGGVLSYEYEANRYLPVTNCPNRPLLDNTEKQFFGPDISTCDNPIGSPTCCGINNESEVFSFTNDYDIAFGYIDFKVIKVLSGDDGCATPFNAEAKLEIKNTEGDVIFDHLININADLAMLDPTSPEYATTVINRDYAIHLGYLMNGATLVRNTDYTLTINSENVYAEAKMYRVVAVPDFSDGQFMTGGLRLQSHTMTNTSINNEVETYQYSYTYGPGMLVEEYPKFAVPVQKVFEATIEQNFPSQLPGAIIVNGAYFFEQSINPLRDMSGYHVIYEEITTEAPEGTTKLTYEIELAISEPNPIFVSDDLSNFPAPVPQYPTVFNGTLKDIVQKEDTQEDTVSSEINTYLKPVYTYFNQQVFAMKGLNTSRTYFLEGEEYTIRYYTTYAYPYASRSKPVLVSRTSTTQDGVETILSFTYDDEGRHNFPVTSSMENSDGKTYTDSMYYVFDYPQTILAVRLVDQNRIGTPWRTTKSVAGTVVDGTESIFAFYESNGSPSPEGNVADAELYVQDVNRREVSWDDTGSRIDNGWFLQYSMPSYQDNVGRPAEILSQGWNDAVELTWTESGKIDKWQFKSFIKDYQYHPNTDLIASYTDIDLTTTSFDYDALLRPRVIENCQGARTTMEYHFSTGGTDKNYTEASIYYPSYGEEETPLTLSGKNIIDGLGRTIQSLRLNQAPGDPDAHIATWTTYDVAGRPSRQYDPLVVTSDDYSPPSGDYRETGFEPSALDRPTSQGHSEWYPSTISYGANVAGEVSGYLANTLNKVTTSVPRSDQSFTNQITYTDRRGRVVLSRISDSESGETNDTYTYYDDKDRVDIMVPPGATLDKPSLIFDYNYYPDDLLESKKLPDRALERYSYNNRDLLTFREDGVMRATTSEPRFSYVFQYDDYGRVVREGFSPDTRPLAHNTYDTYDAFDPLMINEYFPEGAQHQDKIRNTKTFLATKAPGAEGEYEECTYIYDECGRELSQSKSNTFIFDAPITHSMDYSYDAADHVIRSTSIVPNLDKTLTVTNYSEYDHAGRLIGEAIQLADYAPIQLSHMKYTPKEQLLQLLQGGMDAPLQKCDYSYLDNDFLKSINNPADLGTDQDLFAMELFYDQQSPISAAPEIRRNGDIVAQHWSTAADPDKVVTYEYNYLSRVLSSTYNIGTNYNTTYTYDDRGNIKTLTRSGGIESNGAFSYSSIDDLEYDYYPETNQIRSITDDSGLSQGYKSLDTGADYLYDFNGNMLQDRGNGAAIDYTYLNLPSNISIPTSNGSTKYIYAASGAFHKKESMHNGEPTSSRQYLGAFEYERDSLHQINTSQGYIRLNTEELITLSDKSPLELTIDYKDDAVCLTCTPSIMSVDEENELPEENGTVFYNIKDHLGNNRITYRDDNGTPLQVSEHHYYPFGLQMEGEWSLANSKEFDYLYNGKELQREFDLGWYAYGARFYDPAIGRFTGVDPISDQFPHVSTYNYAENRVPNGIDLHGLQYVSAHESLFNIGQGQTWLSGRGFNTYYGALTQYSGGIDSYGNAYVGRTVPIAQVQITRKSGNVIRGTNSIRKQINARGALLERAYRDAPKTKSGNLDRRYTRSEYSQLSGSAARAGKVGLAFVGIGIGIDIMQAVKGYDDYNSISSQLGSIEDAWADVVTAIEAGGFINENNLDLASLSLIANFVYQGTPIANEELQNAAIRITQEISGNYRHPLTTGFMGGGLDNYPPIQYIVPQAQKTKSDQNEKP